MLTRRGLFGLLGAVAVGAYVVPAETARVFLGGGKSALDDNGVTWANLQTAHLTLEKLERTILELERPFRPNQLHVTSQEYAALKSKFKSHVRYSAPDATDGFATLSYMGVPVILTEEPLTTSLKTLMRWKRL